MIKLEQMEVRNLMEKTVIDAYSKLTRAQTEFCTCETCKADAVAYTLNKLKPRYVVSNKGEVITRVDSDMRQTQAEVLAVLLQALEMVGKNPRH